MGKARRRTSIEVLQARVAEIDRLEKEQAKYQAIADGGNAAAAILVLKIIAKIAAIVREIQRTRKRK